MIETWLSILKWASEHKASGMIATFVASAIVMIAGPAYVGEQVDSKIAVIQSKLNKRLDSIEIRQLEERIDGVTRQLCQRPGDTGLIARLRELQADYRELVGERYDAPSCSLLVGERV